MENKIKTLLGLLLFFVGFCFAGSEFSGSSCNQDDKTKKITMEQQDESAERGVVDSEETEEAVEDEAQEVDESSFVDDEDDDEFDEQEFARFAALLDEQKEIE